LEGLGDQAQTVLGGKTPLQVARTPNLDHLVLLGGGGLYHPYKIGAALFSELSLFLSFGYKLEEFPGRGVLAAKAANLEMKEDEVFILASFGSSEHYWGHDILVERIEALSDKEWHELIEPLVSSWRYNGVEIAFYPLEIGLGVLKCTGKVSHYVSDSDPSHRGAFVLDVVPVFPSEEARIFSQALNAYSKYVSTLLKDCRLNRERKKEGRSLINTLLIQGAGVPVKLFSFKERWGLEGAIVCSDPLIKGLALELSMDVKIIPEKDPTSEMLDKLKKATDLLADKDFVAVHIAVPKKAAKRHNPWGKVRVIEEIDKAFSYLLEQIVPVEELLLVIWGGQCTSSSGPYLYSGEPSPVIFIGSRVRKGACFRFDESSLSYGSLGVLREDELMLSALAYSGRAPLVGRIRKKDP